MKPEITENQKKAIRFLVPKSYGLLCSPPGSGKTRIALNLIAMKKFKKILLITTKLGVLTWKNEIEKWNTGFSYLDLHSLNKEQRFIGDHKIDMITFDLCKNFLYSFSKKETVPWDALIIDESMNIKDSKTIRFRSISKICNRFKFRFLINASIATENLIDIWSQVYICDLGCSFGNKTHFESEYTYLDSRFGRRKSNKIQQKKAMDIIKPFTFIMNSDVKHPEIQIINLDMPRQTQKEYSLVKEGCSGIFEDLIIKNSMMKLLMLCSGFIKDDQGQYKEMDGNKLGYLLELVNQFNEPLLINYYFQYELEILKRTFPHGVVFDENKLENWNNGKVHLMFVQATSKALSANLQYGGRIMIWFSLIASFARFDQMNRRIFGRLGSRDDCQIFAFVNKNKFDSRLLTILSEKKELSTNLIKELM